MPKRWQPTPQEVELIADMLDANRPKAAIAKFLYISESTLRRFLARARARRQAAAAASFKHKRNFEAQFAKGETLPAHDAQ